MQTLYRKYRPQDFTEVFGQDHVVKVIQKQVSEDKIGHAYLFAGPRGTGKTSMARLLAKAVNCDDPKDGNPCKECNSCVAIEKGKFLDLIEIDAASNRGIDEIRKLKERVGFSPTEGKKKVYIIDEVHMLTKDAFNALLKTLEEPPEHVVFVLATTEPHKILMTIISRCQRFNFTLAEDEIVKNRLEYICKKEKVQFEEEALKAIVKNSGGSFRDSESILEKVLGAVGVKSDNKIDLEDVRDILGLAEEKEVEKFVQLLLDKDAKKALKIFDKFITSGINIFQFVRQSLEYSRELLIRKVSKQKGDFLLSDLVDVITQLSEAESKLKTAQIRRLPVEVAIVKICAEEVASKEHSKSRANAKNARTDNKQKKENKSKSKKKNIAKMVKGAIEKKLPGNKRSSKDSGESDIAIAQIKKNWGKIIDSIRPFNHHLSAFFRKAEPIKLSSGFLILHVPFRFHKQRIESSKGQQAFSSVINDLFGASLKCSCEVVEQEVVTDFEEEDEKEGVDQNSEVVLEVLGDMIE